MGTPENTPQPQPTPPPAPQAEVVSQPAPQTPVSITEKPITRNPGTTQAQTTPDAHDMDRRTFIKWLVVGWSAFVAVLAGYGTMMMRYMFPNVLFEPKQSFRAGYPDEYQVGEVSERWKVLYSVWIVRDTEKIYAISTVCTHLGCTPNWLPNEGKFKCPCHGSGFYKTGINFEGPAPRPLERFQISLSDDGEIVVDKTKKFQQEKGEWNDPESFILV